jgi:dUTP pyrophosphatase
MQQRKRKNNSKPVEVVFERTHPRAMLPTKGSPDAACWDVYAVHDANISSGQITHVALGLKCAIPKGYEIVVRPRSGLAFKHGISVVNTPGTIDSDYRGPLKVALTCHAGLAHAEEMYEVKTGERIAQIKLQRVPEWVCVLGKVEADTDRGAAGFGSTGK